MATRLEELKAEIVAKLDHVREIARKAEEQNRDFTEREKTDVNHRMNEIESLKAQAKSLEDSNDLVAKIKGLGGPAFGTDNYGDSAGAKFAAHAVDYVKSFHGGQLSDSVAPSQIAATFKRFEVPGGLKTLLTGDSVTSAGALVVPQDRGILDDGGLFRRPLVLRNLLGSATTGTDSVEYVRVTGYTNAASPTPEATAASGTSGTKPESALTLLRVKDTIKTIAATLPATTRALSDAGQVRQLVDSFMRYGIEESIEAQVLNGTGTSEDFTGLNKLADDDDVQDQGWSTDLLTTLRKARTLVETVGRANPNGYVLHPDDIERLDLTQNTTAGNYYFGGPANAGVPRLWGLPVVASLAASAGVGWVADWRYFTLIDRQQAAITVGTVDDQFIRNMVTILCEARVGFAAIRPEAAVRIDLSA